MITLGFSSSETALVIALVLLTLAIAQIVSKYLKKLKQYGPFTFREVEIVQASWVEVTKLGLEDVGCLLFKNIFIAKPSALLFFPFKYLSNMY
jgi:hypothetical protein